MVLILQLRVEIWWNWGMLERKAVENPVVIIVGDIRVGLKYKRIHFFSSKLLRKSCGNRSGKSFKSSKVFLFCNYGITEIFLGFYMSFVILDFREKRNSWRKFGRKFRKKKSRNKFLEESCKEFQKRKTWRYIKPPGSPR